MKQLILIYLLLGSTILSAQTNNPASANPVIPVTPSVSTTTINNPSPGMTNNTNPTTGTVISLKKKNTAKPSTQIADKSSSGQVMPNATPKNSRSKATKKKKNRI